MIFYLQQNMIYSKYHSFCFVYVGKNKISGSAKPMKKLANKRKSILNQLDFFQFANHNIFKNEQSIIEFDFENQHENSIAFVVTFPVALYLFIKI